MLRTMVTKGLLLFCVVILCSSVAYAEKVAVIFTSETHAALYPCRCPKAPNGGVSRRATAIKQLRAEYKDVILIDNGNYFASGEQDPDAQSVALDKKRTLINLRALRDMGYDAVGIGRSEFNFGKEFLLQTIKDSGLTFLSATIDLPGATPFLIKEVAGIRIGILGVSPQTFQAEPGAEEWVEHDFAQILKQAKENLAIFSQQQVEIVIVLSQLGKHLDKQLAEQIEDIDIIIGNDIVQTRKKQEQRFGSSLYVRSHLWARSIGVLELTVEEGKITDIDQKSLAMDSTIADDAAIAAIVPRCFIDKNCFKAGMVGSCKAPGELDAACSFKEEVAVPLVVVQPESCKTCNSHRAVSFLRQRIPSIKVSYVTDDEKQAQALLKKFNVRMLPAFFLEKTIEQHSSYKFLTSHKAIKEKLDNYYWVSPSLVGATYVLGRKFQEDKLDLFINLHHEQAQHTLQITKQLLDSSGSSIDFDLHFLAFEDDETHLFTSRFGTEEVEEAQQALCVMKAYPQQWWDYVFCRLDSLKGNETKDCFAAVGVEQRPVEQCVQSDEADDLLRNNIKLVDELELTYGPLFLLNNQEIFGVVKQTTIKELQRIVK
ncbi:hypothetical protein ACFL38_05425 [Candidatus Omnitrophota bacterium]